MLADRGLSVAGAVSLIAANDGPFPSVDVAVVAPRANADSTEIEEPSGLPTVFLLDRGEIGARATRGGRPHALLAIDAGGGELVAAVEAVANGLIVTDPRIAARAGHAYASAAVTSEPLTNREREVLALVAEGLPNKAIALRLRISEHTAKFHVSQILSKLDAGSRTEAVTRAASQGLLAL